MLTTILWITWFIAFGMGWIFLCLFNYKKKKDLQDANKFGIASVVSLAAALILCVIRIVVTYNT